MGISIGMVGLGNFGSGFADLFMAHPLVDRIALCDMEPERIRKFSEKESWQKKLDLSSCCNTIDELVTKDLDAVVVMTQPWLHAPHCIKVLESGKSVYSAVPLISVPDGDEILDWCGKLLDTVKKTGRHYMLGETTYYRPQAMFCRQKAAEGAFGDFTHIEGEYFHDYKSLYGVQEHRLSSASGKEWGKTLEEQYWPRGCANSPMFYPTHSVSGPLCVTNNKALKVSCFGQKPFTKDDYFDKYHNAFSNTSALFQMSNGGTMRILEHRESSVDREMFRIFGTKASFEGAENQSAVGNLWTEERNETIIPVDNMFEPLPADVQVAWDGADLSSFYGGHGGSHPYLVNEFVESVAQERRPAIDIWDACRYMAAGVTAHKSAMLGGELLDIPDFGDAPE